MFISSSMYCGFRAIWQTWTMASPRDEHNESLADKSDVPNFKDSAPKALLQVKKRQIIVYLLCVSGAKEQCVDREYYA